MEGSSSPMSEVRKSGKSRRRESGFILTWDFKKVVGGTIPVRHGHAADGCVLFRLEAESFRIEDFIADMDSVNLSNDETVAADLDGLDFCAFHGCRSVFDSGWANQVGGKSCEVRFLDFTDSKVQRFRGVCTMASATD